MKKISTFDPEIDDDFKALYPNIKFFSNTVDRIDSISSNVNLKTVRTIIFLWKQDSEASIAV